MQSATNKNNLVFGPVPSRRLGKSIGINNVPHKVCSYSCTYCQAGKGNKIQVKREAFYSPDLLAELVQQKIKTLQPENRPSYITIVPDGEPTLDKNLGKLILNLKDLGLPVAIITNSSLIQNDDVATDLLNADYISFKIDTVNHSTWKHLNKPHRNLNLEVILTALTNFKNKFIGTYVTETMLVKEMNSSTDEFSSTAEFLHHLNPFRAYLSIPTRPPAYKGVFPPTEEILLQAYEVFNWHCLDVEFLTAYQRNDFASSGNFEADLLSITAVHPIRMDAVKELMAKTTATEATLEKLIHQNKVKKLQYEQQTFIVRSLNKYLTNT